MQKILLTILTLLILNKPCSAWSFTYFNNDERAVNNVLKSQVKYANKTNFNKFISTFDPKYVNADGFNLDIYSALIKDIWATYDNIEYSIEILNTKVSNNKATVELIEKSYADITLSKTYDGELKSEAKTIYYLEKINGKWKVVSDRVIDETTSMLYGEAKDLEVNLIVPKEIQANKDYTATLEFEPPRETIAIASLAVDLVEYPQKPTKEVFRALPEDNILERIFTSNNKRANEYIVASIGLTKTAVCDLSLKLSLTGFGYAIKRVNVIPEELGENNVKN